MNFEWLVALRYLRSPNRPGVLRLVTLLAVVGVTAGVTTLVIALANRGARARRLTPTSNIVECYIGATQPFGGRVSLGAQLQPLGTLGSNQLGEGDDRVSRDLERQ